MSNKAAASRRSKFGNLPTETRFLRFPQTKIRKLTMDYEDQTLGGLRKFEETILPDGIRRKYTYAVEFTKFIRSVASACEQRKVAGDKKVAEYPAEDEYALESDHSHGYAKTGTDGIQSYRRIRIRLGGEDSGKMSRRRTVRKSVVGKTVNNANSTNSRKLVSRGRPRKQAGAERLLDRDGVFHTVATQAGTAERPREVDIELVLPTTAVAGETVPAKQSVNATDGIRAVGADTHNGTEKQSS